MTKSGKKPAALSIKEKRAQKREKAAESVVKTRKR